MIFAIVWVFVFRVRILFVIYRIENGLTLEFHVLFAHLNQLLLLVFAFEESWTSRRLFVLVIERVETVAKLVHPPRVILDSLPLLNFFVRLSEGVLFLPALHFSFKVFFAALLQTLLLQFHLLLTILALLTCKIDSFKALTWRLVII